MARQCFLDLQTAVGVAEGEHAGLHGLRVAGYNKVKTGLGGDMGLGGELGKEVMAAVTVGRAPGCSCQRPSKRPKLFKDTTRPPLTLAPIRSDLGTRSGWVTQTTPSAQRAQNESKLAKIQRTKKAKGRPSDPSSPNTKSNRPCTVSPRPPTRREEGSVSVRPYIRTAARRAYARSAENRGSKTVRRLATAAA